MIKILQRFCELTESTELQVQHPRFLFCPSTLAELGLVTEHEGQGSITWPYKFIGVFQEYMNSYVILEMYRMVSVLCEW